MSPTGRSLIGWGSNTIELAPSGDDRVPSPVQKSSKSLQLQQRGNYNDDLPGHTYLPARRVHPDSIGLFLVIGW